jgi:hypothetical protein
MTVLFKRHFQIAYVVDDVQAAMAEFAAKYGVSRWHVMDMMAGTGAGAASPTRFLALAWTEERFMVELIEPNLAVESIYSDWDRASGRTIRFHHLGFLIETAADFAAIRQTLIDSGSPVAAEGSAGDMLDYAYLDTTRALGHYYELIHLKGEGKTRFFASVPHN